MTNKTETVRVPRELFEAVAYFDKGSRTVGELQLWAKDVLMRHDNPIKTPAEDVRAVGDDAVAWRSFDGEGGYDFTDDCETGERWMQVNGPDWVTPLYSRPHRPVVLPECSLGYGHGGTWCGPEYNCWLDRRPKVEK